MEEEKRAVRPDAALSSVLEEAAASLSEKQAEKIASFCDVKGLRKVFSDAELMRTAECFIECSLNISAAARALYMHRNTMMYRLDKIRRMTGLDIRDFYHAEAFSILYAVFTRGYGAAK
ncbi:MAG TPA: helix-turn-helix domain-containing protein [Candidatus Coproplasma excrementavium]|nr:helix-turn-helix domain-containing protein [Candidatus Coproplasma excrementavium]